MIQLTESAAGKVKELLVEEGRSDIASVPYLSEAKIDFVDTLEASGFTIDNPVAQGSCACGHSFH
jgi:Fe-S cluster assembly iron-binding protein IscA